MFLFLFGILLFLAIHLIPQMPQIKARLTELMGKNGYRALHGLVAIVAVAMIAWGYSEAQGDVILWYPPFWTRHLTATLMVFASILLFAAAFDTKMKQWLTSPLSVAIKTWALSHLIANGSLVDVILFGFFLFFAVSYRISIKKRIKAGLVHVPEGRWLNDLIAIALGVGFYVLMVFGLHEWLFGVSPVF